MMEVMFSWIWTSMDTPMLDGHKIQIIPILPLNICSLAIVEPFPGSVNSRVWLLFAPQNQNILDLVLLDNIMHGFIHSLG